MISIILPTYNSIEFLKKRVDTILCQTIDDWECVVIDGDSTDGTWEYLRNIASGDSRFKMFQFSPKGVYNAWNIGVKKSKGDYIYFATSDDTMTSNCLEELLKGFKLAPSCSIAHCCLTIIDEKSEEIKEMNWRTFPAQQYFGELTDKYHIRKAPLVGILYATHQTIIHSFTQILIRRKVFKNNGLFLENAGEKADLEWGMRIGFNEDIIHIPKYLATWRMHSSQLTKQGLKILDFYEIKELMIAALMSNKGYKFTRSEIENVVLFQASKIFSLLKPNIKNIISKEFLKFELRKCFNRKIEMYLSDKEKYHEYLLERIFYNKTPLIEEVDNVVI